MRLTTRLHQSTGEREATRVERKILAQRVLRIGLLDFWRKATVWSSAFRRPTKQANWVMVLLKAEPELRPRIPQISSILGKLRRF